MNAYQTTGAVLALLVLITGPVVAITKGRDVLDAVAGTVVSVFASLLTTMAWPLTVLAAAAAGVKLYLLRRGASR